MAMEDKTLVCKDCGVEFIFSATEQEFYAEKGFQNEPARCPDCRRARKQAAAESRGERQYYTVNCSECGVETQVPFKPTGIRPVYCRDCYQKNQ
ncbi:MAG: zinc-ribbon domain containing protein [Clostridiales bacterium]|nr:zinc-ribbon domain containing protein [Clostridiales bacterium]